MKTIPTPTPTDARALFEDHHACARAAAASYARRLPRLVQADELHAAALEGLWAAARGYDPGRGLAFSTYAAWRMRGAMTDYLRGAYAARRRESPVGRAVSLTLVLVHAGAGGRDTELGDTLPAPAQPDLTALRDTLSLGRRHLPWRERVLLRLYYDEGWTMAEIAGCLGVRETNVSKRLARCLRRMRAALRRLEELT